MARKRIEFNLASPASMQRAVNQAEQLASSAKEFENAMIKQIAERLLMTMKLNADKYPELAGSWAQESLRLVPFVSGNGTIGYEIRGADYIVYIEYGTGNSNGEKTDDAKHWVYYDDRIGFVTTYGQKPKPFIRSAVEEVRATMHEDVSVVFGEWIASK